MTEVLVNVLVAIAVVASAWSLASTALVTRNYQRATRYYLAGMKRQGDERFRRADRNRRILTLGLVRGDR